MASGMGRREGIYVSYNMSRGSRSQVARRQTDETIAAPKKCPSFTLFSCRRYRIEKSMTSLYIFLASSSNMLCRTFPILNGQKQKPSDQDGSLQSP